MEQDNACFRFSKNENIYFRIFWIDITDFTILVGQLVFMTFIHFLDIGSDIYILIGLKNHDILIYFFYVSLSILLLSFISSSIPENKENKIDMIVDFFLGITQINFLIYIYKSFIDKKIDDRIYKLRINESLLESAPQSLLQLYILLQWYTRFENLSIFEISMHYLSITLSLISIAYSMVLFEIQKFNNFYLDNENNNLSYGISNLSIFSSYGICLLCYRITEIFSRIGLLAYFGESDRINDLFLYKISYGSQIFLSISFDFILANIFDIKEYICNNYSYLCQLYNENNNLKEIIIKDLITLTNRFLYKVKFLPVYYEPFSLEYLKIDKKNNECNIEDIEIINVKDNEKGMYIPFKYMHFISKFINNLIIIGFLIEQIVLVENTIPVIVASISCCVIFFINYIFLYFILLWNRKRDEYTEKFMSWF